VKKALATCSTNNYVFVAVVAAAAVAADAIAQMNNVEELSCFVRKEAFNNLSNYILLLLLPTWLLLVLFPCYCSCYCAAVFAVAAAIVSEVELLSEESLNDVFNKQILYLLLLLLLMLLLR
jgi:hypothetical protein